MYEIVSSSADGLWDEYRYYPDIDPELEEKWELERLIDERWLDYWFQFPNEQRPKYWQRDWNNDEF